MTPQEHVRRLLDRARSGDRQAFDALTRPVQERLTALVRSRIGPALKRTLEPEDNVQEAFLKAFESIRSFRGRDEAGLWSWLASISFHLIWNASRKRFASDSSLSLAGAIPASDVTPSRGLRRKERFVRLEKSLAQLRPEYREAILLSKIKGLGAREISARLGRTEASVRQAISRGLKELRERFGDTESLHLPTCGPDGRTDDASE